ncbi:hypothetical protein LEN26_011665 [Aphanomyces euteiches]|nr:hypothetical protein LEN26_011665 [Aphanomyces euteiches]KAH9127990.1 hypothetical protein AeMF1_001795 [Aphanomyces euteiches]KAH9189012.1 hypothetical protein AeNC1_009015 [Aphanomyces euteiches]
MARMYAKTFSSADCTGSVIYLQFGKTTDFFVPETCDGSSGNGTIVDTNDVALYQYVANKTYMDIKSTDVTERVLAHSCVFAGPSSLYMYANCTSNTYGTYQDKKCTKPLQQVKSSNSPTIQCFVPTAVVTPTISVSSTTPTPDVVVVPTTAAPPTAFFKTYASSNCSGAVQMVVTSAFLNQTGFSQCANGRLVQPQQPSASEFSPSAAYAAFSGKDLSGYIISGKCLPSPSTNGSFILVNCSAEAIVKEYLDSSCVVLASTPSSLTSGPSCVVLNNATSSPPPVVTTATVKPTTAIPTVAPTTTGVISTIPVVDTTVVPSTSAPISTVSTKDEAESSGDSNVGGGAGGIAVLVILLIMVIVVIAMYFRQKKTTQGKQRLTSPVPDAAPQADAT